MTEARLTLRDCKAAGYCARGVVQRAKDLNLDHVMLVKEGLPLSLFDDIEDAQIDRVIEKVKERVEGKADGRE